MKTQKKETKKTLIILDAHAIIHRAYHALPSFTNSRGVPTGALYGVSSMILKIVEDLKPDFMVAAYDLPKPTFRHHAYADYKGKRAKLEDDLVEQIKTSRDLFEAFNIPVLDAEGFEADDIVGTLVEKFKNDKKLDIIIASGDMDTLQLVDDKKVRVYTLKKGLNDTIMYDEEAVVARFGFEPKKLIDYKGLRGDPSDNIIGVPGIGEKTAGNIIKEFGSIEGLYEALGSGEGKRAGLSDRIINILKEHQDDALFSKTLATIRHDAPIKYGIPDQDYKSSVNQEKVLNIVSEYEFRSLLPRIKKIFAIQEERVDEDIDPKLLRASSIALWILYSDKTNASYEDIIEVTRAKNLVDAHKILIEDLEKKGLIGIFEKIEKPLISIIDAMERHGILIDQEHFKLLQKKMKERLVEIEKSIVSLTGYSINLNSPKQLSELLFVKLGLKPKGKQKESGAYTTKAETLEALEGEHPAIALVMEYRELQKLLTTYVEALLGQVQSDGRVHAKFLQNGTTTGRFSSTDPNLQNIPIKTEAGKEIRHGFVASPEHIFLGSDYSQIELRVLAMLSGDEALKKTFQKGEDIHSAVASSVFKVPINNVTGEMRRKAKVINFGIIYGMGVLALQKNLGTTRDEAQQFYTDYFKAFPTIASYLEDTKKSAQKLGFTETMFGRRRYFPTISSGAPFLRAMAQRMATNAPLQGTAADIIKIAISLVDKSLEAAKIADKVHLVLQIHDELVYEVHQSVVKEAKDIIKKSMEGVFDHSPIKIPKVDVPLIVSVGEGRRLDELK